MRKSLQNNFLKITPQKSLSKGEWVDFLIVEPEEEVSRKKGKLYAIVSLKGDWSLKGQSLLRIILDALNEYYYQNPEANVTKNLEQSVKFAHRKLVAQLKGKGRGETLFNISVLALWGNVLYIAQTGTVRAALIRKDKIDFIGEEKEESLKEKIASNAICVASGLAKEGDCLILGLSGFWKNIDKVKLKLWLENFPLAQVEDKITRKLSKKVSSFTQCLIFKFSVGVFPSKEEVVKITLPSYEEKKPFFPKGSAIWEKSRMRLSSLLSQKPIVVTGSTFDKRQKNTIKDEIKKDMKKQKELVVSEIEDEREKTYSQSGMPDTQRGKRLKSQNPKIRDILQEKTYLFFKKTILRFKKKIIFVKQELKQNKEGKKENKKEVIESKWLEDKKDPSVYLEKKSIWKLIGKKGLFIAVILIAVLTVSVFFTNSFQEKNESTKENEEKYLKIISEIEETKRVSFSDLDRERVYKKGEKILEELSSGSFEESKINNLKDELQNLKNIIFNIQYINDPKIITDLSFKKEDANPQSMAVSEKVMFLIDNKQGVLYKVLINTGNTEIISLGEAEKQEAIVENEGELYTYSLSGVNLCDTDSQNLKLVIEKDDLWKDVVSLESYYGNLYLLDNQARQIWKYIPVGSNFSTRLRYLVQVPDADFEKAVSLAIDGSIYVLLSDGQIWKFTSGTRADFNIRGLDTDLRNPLKIETYEDFKNIYILDTGNQRVVVLNKEGQYEKQYTSNDWQDLKDLIVNVEEKKMYLLNRTQILEIPLEG